MHILTQMYRRQIIDSVTPASLDPDDIEHGLQLKEEMLSGINDEYIELNVPNWKEVEKQLKSAGYNEGVNVGLDPVDTMNDMEVAPEIYLWFRTRKSVKDNWSDWNTVDGKNRIVILEDYESGKDPQSDVDLYMQMKCVITGSYCNKFIPLHSDTYYTGWTSYGSTEVHMYDYGPDSGNTTDKIPEKEEHFLFFDVRPGSEEYDWFKEDDEWNQEHYPDYDCFTLLCNPFRIIYKPEKGNVAVCNITGQQWFKCDYRVEMTKNVNINILIDKTENHIFVTR